MPKFTQQAEIVFQLAKDAARRMRNPEVCSVHLLLALLEENSGIACNILKNHSFSVALITEIAGHHVPVAREGMDLPDNLPWSRSAQEITKIAVDEAVRLGHDYIGTEHLLIALTRLDFLNSSTVVLKIFGVDREALRQEVLGLLGCIPEKKPISSGLDIRFHKDDLCAYKCGREIKPVLIRKDVKETDEMAFIDSAVQTSVNNLFFLCHTDGQLDNPRNLMVLYLPKIILNLAGILMAQREALKEA